MRAFEVIIMYEGGNVDQVIILNRVCNNVLNLR